MNYVKEVFNPVSFEHAKNISLSPDSRELYKFENETDFFINFIRGQNIITSNSLVLDFGCGMGRVSKKLVSDFGCMVIGTDISADMLRFAQQYVNNPNKFRTKPYHSVCDIDVIIASLVLQHVQNPAVEIQNLYSILKPGGHIILLDEPRRFVPTGVDKNRFVIWNDDGVIINDVMEKFFKNVGFYTYRNRTDMPLSVWKK